MLLWWVYVTLAYRSGCKHVLIGVYLQVNIGVYLKVKILHFNVVKQRFICNALRDLVPFVPSTLLKVTLLHGCFSRFLHCTNGTKSRKASHIVRLYFILFERYDSNFLSVLCIYFFCQLTVSWCRSSFFIVSFNSPNAKGAII